MRFLFLLTIAIFYAGIIIAHAELGEVLIDGEMKELLSSSSLDMREGYKLSITIENDGVVFSVLKDGSDVKREKVKTGDNFKYLKKINSDNYILISIPSFTQESNKIRFRLYQYSEGIEKPKSYTQNAPDKKLAVSDVLKKAKEYAVLLDGEPGIMDKVSMGGSTYYVVSYSNIIPYAGGIEVFSSDGEKISNESLAGQVFTSMAWKEAASEIKPSDIQALNNILETSTKIGKVVPHVLQTSDSTAGLINEELNMWQNEALSVVPHLSSVIPGIEQVQTGGDYNPQFQIELSQMISDFEVLQSRTNGMSERLGSISSTSSAGNVMQNIPDRQAVEKSISYITEAIGGKNVGADSLVVLADSFSRSMREQSSKLSATKNTAARRTDELKGMWGARQNAQMRVYGAFAGAGSLMLLAATTVVGIKRLNTKKNKK